MKICLLAPSPIPFVVGGAEKLFLGMVTALNKYSSHSVELIKLPVFEHNFWGVVKAYEEFSKLNLDHFDLVLTTKYPAWMVTHKNHYVYMQHKLRGFYDLYHIVPAGLEQRCIYSPPPPLPKSRVLKGLYRVLSCEEPGEKDLKLLFEELYLLKDTIWDKRFFLFPGPIIRELVHFMDRVGLDPKRIKSYAAISRTVSLRKDYFPPKKNVRIIYHPTPLEGLRPGRYNYFFAVSRLSDLKRMDLLIKAFRKVKTNMDFYIAGTGPELTYLKDLAKGDPRIKFLGFVSDNQLVELYKDAYAVLFVPYDEDFGLVTLEAMHAAKPVLTCSDSGGVAEMVEHEKTGLICLPKVDKIAEAIKYLVDSPDQVKEMGERARERASVINWENFVKELLDFFETGKKIYPVIKDVKKDIPKIVVLNTFSVFPPIYGGQLRIYYLYRELAQFFRVHLICFSQKEDIEITPFGTHGLEISVPKSKKQMELEAELDKRFNISCGDISAIHTWNENKGFVEILKNELKDASLTILSHPYLAKALDLLWHGPIIYDAHNVEADLKCRWICGTYLDDIKEVEKWAVEKSAKVLVCSIQDKERFIDLYNAPNEKFIVVENGFDINSVMKISDTKKKNLKSKIGLDKFLTTIFIGSYHPPNTEAAAFIVDKLAPECKNSLFLMGGTVCNGFNGKSIPDNVIMLGFLDEDVKKYLLNLADLALNPVETGSGTNLKVVEYAAYNLPVLTTPFGIRGFEFNEDHMWVRKRDEFTNVIKQFNPNATEVLLKANRAYTLVNKKYSWRQIASKLESAVKEILR